MLELRVGALLVLGSYLFTGVAAVLASFHINVFHAFGLKDSVQQIPYSEAHTLLAVWLGGATLFGLQRVLLPALETRIVLISTLTAILAVILSKKRLRSVLWRVSHGGLSSENRLGDILVSDALVSMATILVDIVYSYGLTWALIPASESVNRPAHIGFKTLLIACVPQGIRIKQCVIDYKRTRNRQHLLNLLKYVVSNTPHALRVQMALLNPEIPEEAAARDHLTKLLFSSLIANATYSYLWDVLVDWRLTRLMAPENRHPEMKHSEMKHSETRQTETNNRLRFPVYWYYGAAVADLFSRFTFLFAYNAEHIVFALQTLEITRRAMWGIFRVEGEPVELTDSVEMRDMH